MATASPSRRPCLRKKWARRLARASSSANVSTVPDGWMMTAALSGLAAACSRICMGQITTTELDRCQDPFVDLVYAGRTYYYVAGDRGCVLFVDQAPRPPSAVLTFLFTDIEGSTRRWEADADAMQVAVETHNQVLRDTVEANDGQVFNNTGDGMCAVFTSPRSAVDAAIAAQLALELPVRMGIATGEAELRGGDYFGTVLNRTARVMAAGHGGQILLDGATAALVSDVQLTEFGHRRLRDIAKPVELFRVGAPGLRTEFPPLKTLDSTPGNLKSASTSFVGREMLVAELETAV